MKKLFALLLSLAMTLALAVPAFAAPAPVDGAYTVDGEAVPAYTSRDAIGIIGGADGPTAIFTTEIPANVDVDALKTALGGVPGQIGVLVNGAYVQFPDAVPEISSSRTMIPVRALVETLGGEIGYQDGVVTFVLDGYAYEFTIGSTTVTVTPTADNNKDTPKPDDIVMDCAPYIKGGRTYVPIRFISEALGYEVGWDGDFQTTVLLDRAALAAEIDKDFTILNKVQANQGAAMEEGKNYQADLKGNLTVTAFDTINGNKTYTADLSGKQNFNTEAASAQVSLKLSDNVKDELVKLLISANEGDTANLSEQVNLVLDGLEDMEIILTRKGLGWFRMASLDKLAGVDNVWLGLDLGAELSEMAFAQTGETTIGSALTGVLDENSVISVAALGSTVGMMTALYGDDTFTTDGGVSTRTIGVDDLMALYEDMGLSADDMEEAKAAFEEYQITVKVDSKGGVDMTCTVETAAQAGVPAIKLTMDAKQDAGNATLNMSLHIANLGEGKLTLTQTWGTTIENPEDQPPEGSNVVDAGALLNP